MQKNIKKNNRILFIVHFPPPVHGSSLMGLQIKENRRINETYDCHYINLGTSKTLDEIGKNLLIKQFRYIDIIFKVIRSLIFFRPNLCYLALTAEGSAFYKDTLLISIVKLFRVKLVYHFQNKGVRNSQDNFLDNLLYRFVFKNINVILLSSHLYPDIQKYIKCDFVYYCPNCPSGTQSLDTNIDLHIINSKPKILFLGNMIETKGVYILLDACKILKQKKIDFHCVFVGAWSDITEKQFVAKVAANEIVNDVYYAGRKLGDEKNDFLHKADIFSFPTYYNKECFPLVLLEAMQAGLPVISTFEGGIRDIVEDGKTGFLVPQKDAFILAQKLEQLILDKELRKNMGIRGKTRYEENFTLKHFENNIITILNKCLIKSM